MRTTLALALAAALAAAAPALAGPDCGGKAMTTPMWRVAKGFEEAGGRIRDMKVEDGCYEIKGEQAGRRVEVYFDPTTGTELERETD